MRIRSGRQLLIRGPIDYLDPPEECDARFIFPSIGAEMISSSSLLKKDSSFFTTLLESEFEEGSKVTKSTWKKRARQTAAGTKEFDLRDSDEDDDMALLGTKSKIGKKRTYDVPTHEIVVTETAFSTYRALLFSLHTGHPVEFKPLVSLQSTDKPADKHLPIGGLVDGPPRRPLELAFPRASPRSIYRLASLLEIRPIAEQALKSYGHQLESSLDHVVDEVFCDSSEVHTELRNTAVAVALLNAEKVRKSASYQRLAAKKDDDLNLDEEWFVKLMKSMR